MKFTGSIMKVGNSLVLVLPKSVCDNYEIEKGNSLEIVTTDSGFFVPVKPRELTSIKDVLEQSMKTWIDKNNPRGKKK